MPFVCIDCVHRESNAANLSASHSQKKTHGVFVKFVGFDRGFWRTSPIVKHDQSYSEEPRSSGVMSIMVPGVRSGTPLMIWITTPADCGSLRSIR